MTTKTTHVKRTSDRDDYCTPPELFEKVQAAFSIRYDMACTIKTALTKMWERDNLVVAWPIGTALWCNPPFSNKEAFLKRALLYRNDNHVIVFIVPNNARATKWWRAYALEADLIVNLSPRVHYFLDGVPQKAVPFDSCLLVYYPRLDGAIYGLPKEIWWKWK